MGLGESVHKEWNMRRKDEKIKDIRMVEGIERKEITDIEEIESIIKKAVICRFGFVDGDEPYIAPGPFGYERGALYLHGSLKDRKAELIRKNSKVCFEITTDVEVVRLKPGGPCDWMMRYRRVIGVGRAYILENDAEKSHALRLIIGHYSEGDFSFPKSELDKTLVVKVDIKSITGKKIV
jgi:nitroimidazol reductase NimA-like FMN-containing flavoprotein (pyridoxamine 5'-phosphate oxidase superfamily)